MYICATYMNQYQIDDEKMRKITVTFLVQCLKLEGIESELEI